MLTTDTHFAFNIWDFESAKAVIDAAAEMEMDVILQTSMGVYKKLPAETFSIFVKKYSNYRGIHVWLNLDHCKDKQMIFHAVDHGWDMVMADGSAFSTDVNIQFTNEITEYAHKNHVLVEAEVGQIKGIEEEISVQQEAIASKEEIRKFIFSTNVDFIAVAFGNAHGEYKTKPKLHFDLVKYTTELTDIPFVVHGGSGLSDEVLRRLIEIRGVKKINISTDLKSAYKNGLKRSLENWSQPIAAAEIIHDEIVKIAQSKMALLKK